MPLQQFAIMNALRLMKWNYVTLLTLHCQHCPHSTRSTVYVTVRCPSNHLSQYEPTLQSHWCRFAAVSPARRRDRLIAAAAAGACRQSHTVTYRGDKRRLVFSTSLNLRKPLDGFQLNLAGSTKRREKLCKMHADQRAQTLLMELINWSSGMHLPANPTACAETHSRP